MKSVAGSMLILTTAAGAEVTVIVADGAKVLQLPPGNTDLSSAGAATLSDVAIGDRVLATGTQEAGGLTASRIVLIKAGAIAARNARQQQDWQQRGTSGLVRGTEGPKLTIAAGSRTLAVVTTPATIFRRYAPDSVNFKDARPGALEQIHVGDQLSVRGARSADGMTITADEVVTGTFENLSGALQAVDATAQTVTLKDLVTRQVVTVQVTPNSDLRHLPAQAATAFANRDARPAATSTGAPAARSAGMDLSRMLARLPAETFSSFKPGDAVLIVASKNSVTGALTAITALSGVEQILSAKTADGEAVTLSPWSLSVPDGGGN